MTIRLMPTEEKELAIAERVAMLDASRQLLFAAQLTSVAENYRIKNRLEALAEKLRKEVKP